MNEGPGVATTVGRPRADATKCDPALHGDFARLTAWLRRAVADGRVGAPWEGDFPRYVWAMQGVRAPELRSTWARLKAWLDDTCITLAEDVSTGSVRRSISVPLYPLAEWIAFNWLVVDRGRRSRRRSLGAEKEHPVSRRWVSVA